MTITASPAQTGFLRTLMAERDWSGLNVPNIAKSLERGLTKQEASTLISLLLECPKQALKAAVKAEAGFYVLGELVYRVQPAKSTGNLYAKVLKTSVFGKATWEYAPGMVTKLADAPRLTLEAASSMGHHYGVCMVCARTLTAEESVEAGIGPVCAGRI